MDAMHVFFFFTFSLITFSHVAESHNITAILSEFSEYRVFNDYLTQTKLSDDINTRQTITVLVLNDTVVKSFVGNHPISAVKNALSVHVLLDYFDAVKLRQIGSTQTTTLYQTTGIATGNNGFVNITDYKGGEVVFGSAALSAESARNSSFVKEVKLIPYNISVLEISEPIFAPGVIDAPSPPASDLNVTAVLEKAGCKKFASLIQANGVVEIYRTAEKKGLTIFAPSDSAFGAPKMPDLTKLKRDELVTLLKYHGVGSYTPIGTLKAKKDSISTLATNGAGKYSLTATIAGDEITLHAGLDSSRIATTVIDSPPLCIFTVDNVLLPSELFVKSPSPAPVSVPVPSPSPSRTPSPVPASSPPARSPSPRNSPAAPPGDGPTGSPADIPAADTGKKNSAPGDAKLLVKALLALSAMVTFSAFSFH